MLEKQLQTQIIETLNYSGLCWVWNNNAGMIPTFDRRGKQRRIFVGRAGESDIFGIRKKDGRFLAIEVKLPKTRNRVSPKQKEFIKTVQMCGGVAGVATSPEEALDIVRKTRAS